MTSPDQRKRTLLIGAAIVVVALLTVLVFFFGGNVASFVKFRLTDQPFTPGASCSYAVASYDRLEVTRTVNGVEDVLTVKVPNVKIKATTQVVQVGQDAIVFQTAPGSNYVSDYDCGFNKVNRVKGSPLLVEGAAAGSIGDVAVGQGGADGYVILRNTTPLGVGSSDRFCVFDSLSNTWNPGVAQNRCRQVAGKIQDSIYSVGVDGQSAIIVSQNPQDQPQQLWTYNFRSSHTRPVNEFFGDQKTPQPYRPNGGFGRPPQLLGDTATWSESAEPGSDFLVNFACDPTLPRDDDPEFFPTRCVVYERARQ